MQTVVRWVALLGICIGLAGCANRPLLPDAQALLRDELFQAPERAIDPNRVFAISDAMRAYADRELVGLAHRHDPRRALIDALYQNGQLRLAYDASTTHDAAEAFAARAGNCLSLVIMTASLARHLGLPVGFQQVQTEDFYSRSGGLTLASGHVNLVLGPPSMRRNFGTQEDVTLTVDFLSQRDMRGQRTRPLDEATIVAMYFNNRAVELLAAGQMAAAYWHARAALQRDAGFFGAANTLGVIYHRAGYAVEAEAAFRHALKAEPDNVHPLSNLVRLLDELGRGAETPELAVRLARLQPEIPFQHFNLGRAALLAGEPARALEMFLRELRLQPYQDEVHFWTAQAYVQLGRSDRAAGHLARAVEYSSSPAAHDRYAAKLDHLRRAAVQ